MRVSISPNRPSRFCTVPMSPIAVSGAIAGSLATPSISSAVSGAAITSPWAKRERLPVSRRAVGASPPGAVSGSIPMMRVPSMRPSITGLTSQPARRNCTIGFLQNRLSVATRQPVELPFAKGRGGGIIAGPRLGVDRLHARPKRSGKRQPREKRKELQRIAKPMAEQCREGHADHATRPARK